MVRHFHAYVKSHSTLPTLYFWDKTNDIPILTIPKDPNVILKNCVDLQLQYSAAMAYDQDLQGAIPTRQNLKNATDHCYYNFDHANVNFD